MKKTKHFMHTPANLAVFPVILTIFVVAGYFIWRDAYDDTWRLIGVLLLTGFFIGYLFLFLKAFRIFDYLVFDENTVERHSIFGKKLIYQYSEIYAGIGMYTSTIEEKKYVIFAPKKLNRFVFHIDTSKFGNVISVNRLNFVYCAISNEMIDFLKTRQELEWVNNSSI
jgi:hypothetical protein